MRPFWTQARHALEWTSAHSGIPIVIVAAAAIVISWAIVKKTTRLFIQIAVVAFLLALLTKLGFISW